MKDSMSRRVIFRQPRQPRNVYSSQEVGREQLKADRCQLHDFFGSCEQILQKSRLIRGSQSPVLRSVEEYKLHNSLQSLRISVEGGCYLCTLFWQPFFRNRTDTVPLDVVHVTLKVTTQRFLGIVFDCGSLTDIDGDRDSKFDVLQGRDLSFRSTDGRWVAESTRDGEKYEIQFIQHRAT
jgi:hypothetical protein